MGRSLRPLLPDTSVHVVAKARSPSSRRTVTRSESDLDCLDARWAACRAEAAGHPMTGWVQYPVVARGRCPHGELMDNEIDMPHEPSTSVEQNQNIPSPNERTVSKGYLNVIRLAVSALRSNVGRPRPELGWRWSRKGQHRHLSNSQHLWKAAVGCSDLWWAYRSITELRRKWVARGRGARR